MTDPLLAAGWLEGVAGKLGEPWVLAGLAGQAIFGARFVVQWLASERERRIVVPVAFWWLSIVGAAITLAYAIRNQDPPFILAQAGGLVMYVRNLAIHARQVREAAA
jgi:lipid-A-disaccharide synthase-like uncharacterized protein